MSLLSLFIGRLSAGSISSDPPNSRSGSPSTTSGIPCKSRLPTGPRSLSAGTSSLEHQRNSRLSNSSCSSATSSTSIPAKRATSANGAVTHSTSGGAVPPGAVSGTSPGTAAANQKSMLDKFKLFKDKDKSKNAAAKGKTPKSGGATTPVATPQQNGISPTAETPTRSAKEPEGAAGGAVLSPKLGLKGGFKKTFSRKKEPVPVAPPTVLSKDDPGRQSSTSGSSSIPSRASSTASVSTGSSASATNSNKRSTRPPADIALQNSGASKPSYGSTSKTGIKTPSGTASRPKSGANTPTSGIPGPGTGIPKPGSRSSSATKESSGRGGSTSLTRDRSSHGLSTAAKSGSSTAPRASTRQQPEGRQQQQQQHSITKSMKVNNTNLTPQEHPATVQGSSKDARNVSSEGATQKQKQGDNTLSSTASLQRKYQQQKQQQKMQQLQQQQQHQQQQLKQGKVDSDTQTSMSTVRVLTPRVPQQNQHQSHHLSPQHQHQKEHSSSHPSSKPRAPSPQRSSSPATSSTSPAAQTRSPRHEQLREQSSTKKEHSNSSLNSESSIMSGNGNESNVSSSTKSSSNSNNSASSNDSVIFRPSSCDELESGTDSEMSMPKLPSSLPNSPKPSPALDHISSLRQKQAAKSPMNQKRIETTFDSEVTSQQRNNPGHSAFVENDEEEDNIKPMQPLGQFRPGGYNYLRSVNNSPLLRPSLHLATSANVSGSISPSLSTHGQSASSRLGVNRPLIDPAKLYTSPMRRTMSNGGSQSPHSVHHMMYESDCNSDAEGSVDVTLGYMSDGDVLRSSHHDSDLGGSGYVSEGGASGYAKRMQQRFHEGMMAVKECMEKSSANNKGGAVLHDEDR